jgi:hypothetical protein
MVTTQVQVERFSVISPRPFQEVVAALERAIGHPDMKTFGKNLGAAKTYEELEKLVQGATGPSELMEFMRMDLGEVLRKRNGAAAPRSLRVIVGNPVIMSQMVEHVPDAGSYAPVTILDRRAPRRSSPFLRHDGKLSRPVREPRSSKSRSGSGCKGRTIVSGSSSLRRLSTRAVASRIPLRDGASPLRPTVGLVRERHSPEWRFLGAPHVGFTRGVLLFPLSFVLRARLPFAM